MKKVFCLISLGLFLSGCGTPPSNISNSNKVLLYDVPNLIGKSAQEIREALGKDPFIDEGDQAKCEKFQGDHNYLAYCYDLGTEGGQGMKEDKIITLLAEFTFLKKEGQTLSLNYVSKKLNLPELDSPPDTIEPSKMELGKGKPGVQLWENKGQYKSIEASYYYGTAGDTINLKISIP